MNRQKYTKKILVIWVRRQISYNGIFSSGNFTEASWFKRQVVHWQTLQRQNFDGFLDTIGKNKSLHTSSVDGLDYSLRLLFPWPSVKTKNDINKNNNLRVLCLGGRTGRFIWWTAANQFWLQHKNKKHKHCAKPQYCFGPPFRHFPLSPYRVPVAMRIKKSLHWR